MKNVKEFWKQWLALGLFVLVPACGDTYNVIDDGGDDPPPPPPPPEECEGYQEQEPNDELEDSQFIAVLPFLGKPDDICAKLDPFDLDGEGDSFYFWLQPDGCPGESCVITTNWVVRTHSDVLPIIEFYQSMWSDDGTITERVLIGTFFGTSGKIEVLNYNVIYNWAAKRDLYVKVKGLSGFSTETYDYDIEWWTD